MNSIKYLFILLTLLLFSESIPIYSQTKYIISASSDYYYSSKENLQPHYFNSNNWGVLSSFQQSQALIQTGAKYQFIDNRNFKLKAGVSAVFKNNIDESFLHEAYLDMVLFKTIDFSLGKETYSPLSYNDTIMVGGFMRNSNARPIPRAQIGFWNYVPLRFLNNRIAIKGGLSHGILNDDRTSVGKSNSADDLQVHEKWAYIKVMLKAFQPYVGLYHGALLGGTRPDGTKIPVDYWSTFFGKGSSKIGGGEATNAAGAHDGFWDFGCYFDNDLGEFLVYMQKPYADGSGLKLYNFRNHDYKIGTLIKFTHGSFINSINLEIFKTNYQSGSGVPDPIYPAEYDPDQHMFLLSDITDYDEFMLRVYGEYQEDGFTKDEVKDYLREQNHGKYYSGRDDYNNNGTYYNGWTYNKQAMGFPLYHTIWQVNAYAPDWQPNGHLAFINNRVKGFHIGMDGTISKKMNYIFKATYSNNFGAYSEEYIKRYSWTIDENNFYKGGKKQVYSYLDFTYSGLWHNYLNVNTSFAYDFGDLYHSFGFMIGLEVGL